MRRVGEEEATACRPGPPGLDAQPSSLPVEQDVEVLEHGAVGQRSLSRSHQLGERGVRDHRFGERHEIHERLKPF